MVLREGREDNFNRASDDLSKYKVVRKGDLVLNKMKTWQGSLGVSHFDGIVSPAYFVGRRVGEVDDRYAHHLLRSAPLITEYGARSKGIRPSQWDLPWDEFASIKVRLPALGLQRAIADYLDTETARIDALIAKKHQLADLLIRRQEALLSDRMRQMALEHGVVPLKRLLSKIEQGVSPVCVNRHAETGEWGVLKTSAVSTGTFVAHENKHLPDPSGVDLRWKILDGDLLMTRGSGSMTSVGQAAVARPGGRQLLLPDLIYRLCLRLRDADPDFVALALRSSQGRQQIQASIRSDVGQTLKLRADDIRELRIPALPAGRQKEQFRSVVNELEPLQDARALLNRQVGVLRELRQALITAAVRGELEISGAA